MSSVRAGSLCLFLWGLALPAPAAETVVKTVPLAGFGHGPARLSASASLEAKAPSDAKLEALWKNRQRLLEQLGPHGVSRKGIERRMRWLADRASGKRAASSPDTLDVLLIRIAFESDRSGRLTSITEDGNFLLREAAEGELFDRPPHDKAYFEAHLGGLAEYWRSQSAGRLVVRPRVLPEGGEDAYFLGDIADYGPGRGGFWDIDDLVRLVQDMVTAADAGTLADQSVSLSDFDFDDPNTYIVFAHAGGDIQSNLVYEEGDPDYSPNDIPTFFVQLGDDDVVDLVSVDSETNEPGHLSECSVIPETTSQDGLLGSIAAALYHEFGHALGLPDLYSTATGLPSLGWWDLMDSGTNLAAGVALGPAPDCDTPPPSATVLGLLPPSISVWSKWYLGWLDPVVASAGMRKLNLNPSFDPALPNRAMIIDVSPNEFFLVENRWIPPSIPDDENWALIQDRDTGVVQFLGRLDAGGDLIGNTNMYDFYLPWLGGLMVYRIRQDRVDATVAFNAVQLYSDTQAITLVEADGIRDIGRFDIRTRGFWGSDFDAFRKPSTTVIEGECGNTRVNFPMTASEFTPTSSPSSVSGFRLSTGARIEQIPISTGGASFFRAGIDGLVELSVDPAASRWPLWLGEIPGDIGMVPLQGDAQSLTLMPFRGVPSFVFAAHAADGSNPWALYAYGLDSAPRFAGAGRLLVDLDASLAGPPIADPSFDAQAAPALIAVTTDGTVYAIDALGRSGGSVSYITGFPVALSMNVDAAPSVVHDATESYVIAASLADNLIRSVDAGGTVHPEWDSNFALSGQAALMSAPVVCDLDGDGIARELAFVAGSRLRGTDLRGNALLGMDALLPVAIDVAAAPARLLAWPDARGGPDRIVIVASDQAGGVLMRSRWDGAWSVEQFGRRLEGPPRFAPALGDLDGDGNLDLAVVTDERIWVRNDGGADLRGWPLRLFEAHWVLEEFIDKPDDGPASAPLIADIDDDGANELIVVSRLGLTHAFETDAHPVDGWPRLASGAVAAPLLFDYSGEAGSRRGLALFEALGDSLSRGGRSRSTRLNALDLGPAGSQPGPAEWTAWGGSSARRFRRAPGEASVVTGPSRIVRNQRPRIFPNPARGESARVRFYSGAAHEARVVVYNLEGEELRRVSRQMDAGSTREVDFSVRGLAPGPYVCRLDYVGRDGPATDVLTLYVE